MKRTFTIAAATASAFALSLILATSALAQQPGGGQGRGQGRGQGGFGGQGRGGFGRMMGMGGDPMQSGRTMLIQRPDVQNELGISAKQRDQMAEIQKTTQEEMRTKMQSGGIDFGSLRDLPAEERRAKMEEFRTQMQKTMQSVTADVEKKMEGVLTPAQLKRLSEIDLQQRGPLALGDDKVASQIKLTPDQQRQVSNIVTGFRTAQQAARPNFGGPGGFGGGQPGQRPDPEEMRKRFEDMQKEADKLKKETGDKVVALLTDAQKQTWKTMLGKPFTLKTNE